MTRVLSGGEFLTLAAPGAAELRIRGSTFLSIAAPAADEEAARQLLANRERAQWDATHHCSAWLLRNGGRRASDGGEPSGSAGPPILAAIEGAGLTDCAVIVTRYYGGTKLGVGGLVRAYGEAAALALEAAPKRVGTPALRLRVRYSYEHTGVVMRAIEQAGARAVEHGFAAGGREGEVEFTVVARAAEGLRESLRDGSSGALVPEALGEGVLWDGWSA